LADPSLNLPVDSERISLREPREGALESLGWPKAPPAGRLIEIDEASEPIGFLEVGQNDDRPRIQTVWLAPSRRRGGLGVEAARTLVEALAVGDPNGVVEAFAPAETGLLVYFWLRLGFAPLGSTPAGLVLARRMGRSLQPARP
jgi:hypothetical protein